MLKFQVLEACFQGGKADANTVFLITCSTVVLQCYRRQAIPMEQGKIRPSIILYSFNRSLPKWVWLRHRPPIQMPVLVEFGNWRIIIRRWIITSLLWLFVVFYFVLPGEEPRIDLHHQQRRTQLRVCPLRVSSKNLPTAIAFQIQKFWITKAVLRSKHA